MIIKESEYEISTLENIKDEHFTVYTNIVFSKPLTLHNLFISRFYNCHFYGLSIDTNANDIEFINCTFLGGNVKVIDGVTVNFIGGSIEGSTDYGLIINGSNLVNIYGVYFENNAKGDIQADCGYNSSININNSYFNAIGHVRKSIQAIGSTRPNVSKCFFTSKMAYNLIDVRCRTKSNSFDSLIKKIINV